MKFFEEKVVTEKRVLPAGKQCDLCGKKDVGSYDDWDTKRDVGNCRETEVRFKWGSNWPEMGAGKEIVVDICPECFMDKLVPWLKSQGVNVTEKEWDW